MPTHRALIQPKPVRENIRLDPFEQAQRESPPNVPRWRDAPALLLVGAIWFVFGLLAAYWWFA